MRHVHAVRTQRFMDIPTVDVYKRQAVDTVYDVVGSILFAIGVYTFAKSADFAPGGVSGLSLIHI